MTITLLYVIAFGLLFGAYAYFDLRKSARVQVGEKLSNDLLLLQLDADNFARRYYDQLSESDRHYAIVLSNLEGTQLGRVRRLQKRRSFNYALHTTLNVSRHGIDVIEDTIAAIESPQLVELYRTYQRILLAGFEAHLPEPQLKNVLSPYLRLALLPKNGSIQINGLREWYAERVYELR